jgi:hypothetical protein
LVDPRYENGRSALRGRACLPVTQQVNGRDVQRMIVWHSRDPTLKPRIHAEAQRRGITVRELLDEMAGEYFEKAEFLAPLRAASEAKAANRAISTALESAKEDERP